MWGELKDAAQVRRAGKRVHREVRQGRAGMPGYRQAKIALVIGEGDILRGDPGDNGAGEAALTSYGFNKLLNSVESDASISGVIVRIDSPGGEVTASDDIVAADEPAEQEEADGDFDVRRWRRRAGITWR